MTDKRIGSMSPYSGTSSKYDERGSCIFWQMKAEELRRASELVWQGVLEDLGQLEELLKEAEGPKPEYRPPVMYCFVFLAALAIENLLKGILVTIHPEYVMKGKLRGNVISSHNLILLADEAGITLAEEERVFCELGSSAIEDWGRYPIPKNVSKLKSAILVTKNSYQAFEGLFGRLCDDLSKRCPDRRKHAFWVGTVP